MGLGLLGVLAFSVSLPVTRVAVREFGVLFVSFGRAVVAGLCALVLLRLRRVPLPSKHLLPRFALVVGGVVVGFPAFTGLALQRAGAGHGAIVIGLLPAATAGLGVLRAGDRPTPRFWLFASLGALSIVVLSLWNGSKELAVGDLFLVLAVCSAAIGYTEGALISRGIGSWQTISWAVVFALPVTVTLAVIGRNPVQGGEPLTAWTSFAYLGVVSMYLGFFAWYAGLAKGGIARVSQVQLFQPLFSLTWAALFLREELTPIMGIVALVVLASVAGSKRAAVR
jgi:drug/metabolite transporter (DMT)-like permease